MVRYFLHLRDGTDEVLDPDGEEHGSLVTLAASVLNSARSLISADVLNGVVDLRYRIDAEDEDGIVAHTLAFSSAFEIIPEAA